MSLQIKSIRLHDFRSYADVCVPELSSLVVLTGPNAAGKTNFIEGIQLITALDSFRNPKTDQLIRWDADQASVSAVLRDGERKIDVGLYLDSRGRHFRLNGKQRPRQELQGTLPAIVFSPDDLQLVKGSPELRRNAIDALGIQVSRNYLSVKRDYEKILKQKNRLLKDEVSPSYLASVNEVLVKIGSQLFLYRLRVLRGLRALLPERHHASTASEDSVSFEYAPSFRRDTPLDDAEIQRFESDRALVEEEMHQALTLRSDEEYTRKTSLIGPHRDIPDFHLNSRSASDFASQGQQRSIVIAYKLSELRYIEQTTNVKPILLLDDVMSELDSNRRAMLTGYIHEAAQTFITTTNLDYFTPDFLEDAPVITLPMA